MVLEKLTSTHSSGGMPAPYLPSNGMPPMRCRLKLPPYRTAQQIRDKLLYAIQSGAGFELS